MLSTVTFMAGLTDIKIPPATKYGGGDYTVCVTPPPALLWINAGFAARTRASIREPTALTIVLILSSANT